MDIDAIKGVIIEKLKETVGLDDGMAQKAADVVADVLKEHIGGGIAEKLPGGVGDALGGLLK
ncbi:MAG: hypothetical protein AAF447_19445 [Myxococcota bacterium]